MTLHDRQIRKEFENGLKNQAKRKAYFIAPPLKEWKPIRKVSTKRKEENEIYSELREEFLKTNPECQASGCSKESEDVHHMIGRGKELNNTKYWLAVCRNCHIFITDNPLEAIKRNLSFSRLEKRETI